MGYFGVHFDCIHVSVGNRMKTEECLVLRVL